MLTRLKTALSLAPTVDFVDYEDGLLTVRCKKALSFDRDTVKLKTTIGTMLAQVSVESYEANKDLYRLKVLGHHTITHRIAEERRDAVRLNKVVRVTSKHFPDFAGTTEDISTSGLRVNTRGPLDVDREIHVTLELDDILMPSITVQTLVAWSGEKSDGSYQSGLRITAVHPDAARLIDQYIKTRIATEKKLHTLEDVDPFELM